MVSEIDDVLRIFRGVFRGIHWVSGVVRQFAQVLLVVLVHSASIRHKSSDEASAREDPLGHLLGPS